MRSRILALVGECYGSFGGIARYNQDLFEALADGETEIVILPRNGDARGFALPAGIRQKRSIFSRLGFSVVSLVVGWREGPFDVVFCGHPFMAPFAWGLARLLGARYWLQTHGIDIGTSRRGVARRAVEAADLVTAVSRATRDGMLAWANLACHRARVLPDTVRDEFAPGSPSAELKERLALGPGPVLLTVGRLAASERYKGHEQVFAVLSRLRRTFPNLVHLVAGDGDDRPYLQARARALTGSCSVVRFLGYVSEAELLDLYRLADLYVMPSTQEGFGIVYLEAAACGLRVVGGIGGGSADAIPGEHIGLLVDPSDRQALIDAIVRLLSLGRTEPSAVEPYRRKYFARAARRLLVRLLAGQPRGNPEP